MAEEKKTTTKPKTTTKKTSSSATKTSTTKKTVAPKKATTTTKKKEAVEEVHAEKRFCTKCGKELNNGEVCSCEATSKVESPAVTINKDAIMNTGKNIWHTIIDMLKKPASTIDEELKTNDTNKSIILLIILAITFALYLMAVVSSSVSNAVNSINSLGNALGTTSKIIQVPYFKIFIYGILIYAIISVIPMLATLIVAKITHNNNYNLRKAFKLYAISNAPLTIAYLGISVILLLNISLLNVLGYIAFAIISISCFFNFILTFDKLTTIREDRRSYALTSVLIIWVVIEIVAVLLVAGSVINDLYDMTSGNKLTNSNNNSFRW